MLLIQTYRESDSLVEWLRRLVGVVADVEEWRDVGDTNEPAFENSWANIANEAVAAFYRDPYHRVHIKGHVDSGSTGNRIFTLPENYRPDEDLVFICFNSAGGPGPGGASVYVTITTDGYVVPTFTGGVDMVLDGISFRV